MFILFVDTSGTALRKKLGRPRFENIRRCCFTTISSIRSSANARKETADEFERATVRGRRFDRF